MAAHQVLGYVAKLDLGFVHHGVSASVCIS
jgi:hypothetical protein